MTDLPHIYHNDYSEWARRNRELLRAGRFDELDIEHLLEELSDMGKSERDELESRLLILLAHLLKWEYRSRSPADRWREFDGRSWRATIVEQRKRLAVRLRKSPGLKSALAESIAISYPDARDLASKETGLPLGIFPAACPYSQEPIVDDDYYPDR
jgi:hypothetical protein